MYTKLSVGLDCHEPAENLASPYMSVKEKTDEKIDKNLCSGCDVGDSAKHKKAPAPKSAEA